MIQEYKKLKNHDSNDGRSPQGSKEPHAIRPPEPLNVNEALVKPKWKCTEKQLAALAD